MSNLKMMDRIMMFFGGIFGLVFFWFSILNLNLQYAKPDANYFPSEFMIIGSGSVEDWGGLILAIAFMFGLFPVYALLIVNRPAYKISRIIQILIMLPFVIITITNHGAFYNLAFAAFYAFFFGFWISQSIIAGMGIDTSII